MVMLTGRPSFVTLCRRDHPTADDFVDRSGEVEPLSPSRMAARTTMPGLESEECRPRSTPGRLRLREVDFECRGHSPRESFSAPLLISFGINVSDACEQPGTEPLVELGREGIIVTVSVRNAEDIEDPCIAATGVELGTHLPTNPG